MKQKRNRKGTNNTENKPKQEKTKKGNEKNEFHKWARPITHSGCAALRSGRPGCHIEITAKQGTEQGSACV
jgi:hypothetical protein